MTPFNPGAHDFYFLPVSAVMPGSVFFPLFSQLPVNADPEPLGEPYHQGLFPIDYVLAIPCPL